MSHKKFHSEVTFSLHFALRLLAVTLLLGSDAGAVELLSISWPTTHASPPPQLDAGTSQLLPAFRLGMAALPESAIVSLALSQPSILQLSPAQAAKLQPLTAERYRLMDESPVYSKATSALPYCFSAEKPTSGLATIYVPDNANASTPVIIFLHGYGGSFLWYQHYLSELFPMHIIACPAYGISTATIPPAYLAEMMAALKQRLGFQPSQPSLIGLSAGGFGACRLYVQTPKLYARLICLAAYPLGETVARFNKDMTPCFLAGAAEPFVTSGEFHKKLAIIKRTCPKAAEATIPGADHFFLLSHRAETATLLQRWLAPTEQK